MSAGVVIAGGGLSAQRCAEALRQGGYGGAVTIVSNEAHPPYDRPPLSKALLAGEKEQAEISFRSADWYEEQGIELLLGDGAAGLDVERRKLLLESGARVDYEHLVIATGSRARQLPGSEQYENIHSLRTLDDAIRLRGVLRPGQRLVVLGAGLIGQEVAATAIGHGAEVTLIEAEPLPLARALHPELAQWLVDLQREEGVEVKLGARVTELIGDGDRLESLLLDDGSRVELDEMLVAIGVIPNSDWLPDEIGLLTARPDIHGAGDVAGGDHWELAAHQGKAVAHAILGQEPAPVPFTGWWSDVHGVRLQGLGQPAANDEIVFEGSPGERDFHAVVSRDGVPVAALAVGQPREIPRLRKLLTEHASTQPAKEAA